MSSVYRELLATLSSDSSTISGTATLNTTSHEKDLESLALLRQIFPDESIQDLKRLHQERLIKANAERMMQQLRLRRRSPPTSVSLPDDFLRLPMDMAVRRYQKDSGKWEYQLVKDLQKRALVQQRVAGKQFYSQVLPRHPELGLGITLTESGGWQVRVHAIHHHQGAESNGSTKLKLQVGDILVGVNGYALPEIIAFAGHSLLRQTVAFLKTCPSPVVLHLQKPLFANTVSLLDTTMDESMFLDQPSVLEVPLHPLAKILASHGYLTSPTEEASITTKLQQFTERARQWEFSNSFRIDSQTFELLASFDVEYESFPAFSSPHNWWVADHPLEQSPVKSVPTTVSVASSLSMSPRSSYPGWRGFMAPAPTGDIFIPLVGVRKALSVRILNSFLDGECIAYTIWVHDIESGREWYAPLRYFRDFQDLRAAALNLRPCIGGIAFPSKGWSLFGPPSEASDSDAVRETKCRQLEHFLRALCTMIYTEDLHPAVAEVAIHVQSFLGCDGALDGGDAVYGHSLPVEAARAIDGVNHTTHEWRLRTLLKRQLQMIAHRVFLLESVRKLVDHFVDTARANGPSLREIEIMQAKSHDALKKHSMDELKRIQAVMDRLQDLLVEGCADDFCAVALGDQHCGLRDFLSGKAGQSYLDRLVREAVREQVEIEVYLPLRGTTSRMLVNAWRHEDMEVAFKVQELRKRPQNYFRIPVDDDENWDSVSGLLKNVSLSTLPCAKLRAIVDAATEISRLFRDEHQNADPEGGQDENNPKHMGADDFLPIFIFCVIRADMDRPCALCALLRTLCDPINRMGEVGYYLASFEAAITHIREMDLSEKKEEMFSFLSIPLSDGSFG